MAVANATAAIVQKAPPYVSYRISGTVHYGRAETAVARDVVVQTADGDAVVRDEASGGETLRPPFPAPPTFDALAHWRLEGTWSTSDVDLRVVNIEPLRFGPVVSSADAVARGVRGYRIAYGPPDGTQEHLHLDPTPEYFRGTPRTAWLTDVWYDPATRVPSRIVCAGNEGFALDARYATVDGVWLLRSLRVAQVFHEALGVIRIGAWFSGEYGDYRFSASPPDLRLVPPPSPATPAPGAGNR